jgi:hypothetical protein
MLWQRTLVMNDLPAPMLIWCPFPDVESAQKAARVLSRNSGGLRQYYARDAIHLFVAR